MKLINKFISVLIILMVIYPLLSLANENPSQERDFQNIESINSPLGYDTMPIDEAIEKYKEKFNLEVLKPTYFPFDPTHIGANLYDHQLKLHFYNEHTKERLKMYVYPDGIRKGKLAPYEETIYLEDGTKAIYFYVHKDKFEHVHFVKNGVDYEIGLYNSNGDVKEKLIKITNSLK